MTARRPARIVTPDALAICTWVMALPLGAVLLRLITDRWLDRSARTELRR